MCINLEVSLLSYIIGIILFIAVYKRNKYNDMWISVLMVYILQIQLLEAIMWLDQDCTGINQMASKIAYIVVICQPLANYLAMMYTLGQTEMTNMVTILLVPYFINSLIYGVKNFPTNDKLCSKPTKKYWLNWRWKDNSSYWTLWIMAVFIPFLALPDKSIKGLLPVIYVAASQIFSYVIIPDSKDMNKSSLWCLLQVLLPAIMLLT